MTGSVGTLLEALSTLEADLSFNISVLRDSSYADQHERELGDIEEALRSCEIDVQYVEEVVTQKSADLQKVRVSVSALQRAV
jgi:hypothetical protein